MEAVETPAIKQESQIEGDLAVSGPLEIAHKNVHAMQSILNELALAKAEHAQLQSDYYDLKRDHEALQKAHATKEEDWDRFKVWWKSLLERKKSNALAGTPTRGVSILPSSPMSLGAAGASDSAVKAKPRFTKEDMKLLTAVGLDLPTSTSAVPKVNVKIEPELRHKGSTDTPEPSTRREEGRVCSDRILVASSPLVPGKKRTRESSKDDVETPRSRMVLGDISNRSSNASFESPIDEKSKQVKLIEHEEEAEVEKMQVDNGNEVKTKGRGRYSTGMMKEGDTSRTLHAEFEVDPERNGNVSYLHKSVVRNKAERKQMHGYDCSCCSAYYSAVGEAPLRKYQDPRTLKQLQRHDNEESNSSTDDDLAQLHRQQISRHRGYGPPASTPPHYWDVAFPDTQKQEEINTLARQEHIKKREQLAKDPRFKKRKS